MHDAQSNVLQQKKSRMQMIEEVVQDRAKSICVQSGTWLALALDMLLKNEIPYEKFANDVYTLLEGGRRKHKNFIIVGESNCAKTFLLKPLDSIFPVVFHTPAESSWVDGC